MKRGIAWGAAGVGAWMAACRWTPGLAAGWLSAARPALMVLHRLTVAAPFPLIEPLALLCLGGPRRLSRALLLAAAMYALLWYPAYWATPAEAPSPTDAARLEWLCAALAEELNEFPYDEACLDEADEVAGLPGVRVKTARFPEWMAALRVSGLFSPWTGEVVLDPATPAALAPFTCVHEIMHLKGIADEGAANIAACEACLRRGGAFARSAKLWGLRCALQRLNALDPDAAARAAARVSPDLLILLSPADPAPEPSFAARLLGIAEKTVDYDALADWLAREY